MNSRTAEFYALRDCKSFLRQVKGEDIQPLAPDAPAAVETKGAGDADKKKEAAPEEPQELSFVEKLALKVAKLTGSVPVEVVFQEKV